MKESFVIEMTTKDIMNGLKSYESLMLQMGCSAGDVKGFHDDMRNLCSEAISEFLRFAADELTETAALSIEAFYGHYSPRFYKRHNTYTKRLPYNFEKNSFKRRYDNSRGTLFRGGVEVDSSWMDEIYRKDADYVSDLVYSGYHGYVEALGGHRHIPPVMRNSPYKRISKKYEELCDDAELIINEHMNEASSGGEFKYLT